MENENVVNLVNCMLQNLQLGFNIRCFEDITPHVFLDIFEALVGEPLSGAKVPSILREDKEWNCRLILEKLSAIVGVSLDHISPRSLVTGDHVAIANLVEIFSGLMEQLMDSIATETESDVGAYINPVVTENVESSSSLKNSFHSADELESRYPNIFSVVGRERATELLDSQSPFFSTAKSDDSDLASLLNLDVQRTSVSPKSPLLNKKPTVSRRSPFISSRHRKVARLPSTSKYSTSPTQRRVKFSTTARPTYQRIDDSAPAGYVLDRSNFKATYSDLKSELANEKAALTRRLQSVKNRYHRAEIAAKFEADDAGDDLQHRYDTLNTEAPPLLRPDVLAPKASKKVPDNSFARMGFLSKTHAEQRKKQAVKRLCAKYRSSSKQENEDSTPATSRNDLIARLQVHFPSLILDDATSRRLWGEYSRHIQALARVADNAKASTRRHVRESTLSMAERQQQILLKIVRKEMAQAKRLREENERRKEEVSSRNRVLDAKIQQIRSQRYHTEFVEQARARLANKQFGEEMIFRNLFREAVKAQRERLLDLATAAREIAAQRDSAETKRAAKLRTNFQERLRLLNEKVASKRFLVELQEKEQAQYLNKMKREMRGRLEGELRAVQAQMASDFAAERVAFRELDAESVKMQIYAEAKQTQPFLK